MTSLKSKKNIESKLLSIANEEEPEIESEEETESEVEEDVGSMSGSETEEETEKSEEEKEGESEGEEGDVVEGEEEKEQGGVFENIIGTISNALGVQEEPKKTKKQKEASENVSQIKTALVGEDEQEYDTDEDDDAEENMKKFDKELRENYILKFHPEVENHNYDEIYNLSKVVRDENGIIIDELHKTIPILTKYEKTRILGIRAKQINDGAKPFIKIDETMIDGYLIALKELEQKKIPFIIRRPLPNRGSEYWKIDDLELII